MTGSGIYPYGAAAGIINNYESTGVWNQKQLIVNVNSRISSNFSLFGYYTLSYAYSDTDGVGSNPSDPYNLRLDYGPTTLNSRHRALIAGSIATPKKWGNLRFSPFISYWFRQPFDITTGKDLNGNTYFDNRPAFAPRVPARARRTNIKCTQLRQLPDSERSARFVDTDSAKLLRIGPAYFSVNLRMSRTWGFGGDRTSRLSAPVTAATRRWPRRRWVAGGGGSRGGGGGGCAGCVSGGGGGMLRRPRMRGGDSTNQRYNVTLSINARNYVQHA